ncbi:DUF3426 domain-containing protein [Psychrobacter sp. Ps6]|uniref:DUF3426 domain-containing protein n=1 Tax=Psychrobacter sp. Ps6 TaxID=2790960 RepID=UPI001EE04142|nr:DUF3426 domain-containing protein [Psychrobacter sp. Ps6]MCG3878749.1 DUF3426 domain-containing protein [Psychrobacter sp. Ps6]
MTTPIKTQCPHCQACFKVQQNQLNKANATINCTQCQKSFSVNQHLIVTPDTSKSSSTQHTATAHQNAQSKLSNQPESSTSSRNQSSNISNTAKSSLNKKRSSDMLIHDDLIYDDMDIDEPEDSIVEYDSLDSMDAWLTQVSDTNSATTTDNSTTIFSKTNNKSQEQFLASPTDRIATEHSSMAQEVLSSTAANDIHASINDTADNSWLEALLEEQNKREAKSVGSTDLSQLLIDMGVPLRDEENSVTERTNKAQAQFAPTSTTHSIASILWILGCLVLALLLAAQYVMFNLETLVKNPANAQRLQTVCSIAACSLPSADLTALTITNPSHRSSQIKTTGAFSDISAILNNQSTKAQLYPNIKVSVYGTDNLIGEFIAAPNDYLLGKPSQLAASNNRQLLFTIPVDNAQIREITMTPLY